MLRRTVLAARGQSLPWPWSTWSTGGFADRRRSRGNAEGFHGRHPSHPARADLFHRLLGIALALPLLSGCSTLITAAYLLQPADVPAEYAGLKGKHVAVVCKPIVELEFSDAGSSRELASLVGGQLQQAVRKVKVIGQHEVARWIDENAWVDYPTLGKALDANYVVGIDLEGFRLHEGATLYRGRATVHVRVFDVDKKEVVFEKRIDDYTFPGDSAIPTTDRSEAQFRALFLQQLALKISRSFHAYESRDVFASDNHVL